MRYNYYFLVLGTAYEVCDVYIKFFLEPCSLLFKRDNTKIENSLEMNV